MQITCKYHYACLCEGLEQQWILILKLWKSTTPSKLINIVVLTCLSSFFLKEESSKNVEALGLYWVRRWRGIHPGWARAQAHGYQGCHSYRSCLTDPEQVCCATCWSHMPGPLVVKPVDSHFSINVNKPMLLKAVGGIIRGEQGDVTIRSKDELRYKILAHACT